MEISDVVGKCVLIDTATRVIECIVKKLSPANKHIYIKEITGNCPINPGYWIETPLLSNIEILGSV